MSLANRINELLTRDAAPERKGIWRWVYQLMPAGLTGVKIALAVVLLAEAATDDGLLDGLTAEMNALLSVRFGRGLSPENAAIALAAVVLLQDGGKRGMSILQKTLEAAIKPLLTERFQKGMEVGLERGLEQGLERGLEVGLEQGLERGIEENQRLWEEWLERQRDSGWNPDDPPPSEKNGHNKRL